MARSSFVGWVGAMLIAGASLPVLLASPPAAALSKTYTLNADFDTGVFNNSVDTNPNNQIVLGPTPVSKTTLVWATNYRYGWVVRLNSLTGKQTSRFDSSLQFINGVPTGAPPPNEYCDFASTGNCPGRVAVDANGDVWIINRAFGKQGSLSKFSGNLSHCIDRNNNGIIETSFDANNDGQISVVAGAGEYFGQNDECILTTIKTGPVNVYPRGVAVDKRGKIWVATHNDGKIYRYNPNEPVNLEATVTTGGNPYSLATGKDYVFVSSSSGNLIRRVHITNLTMQTVTCAGLIGTYGVVGDPNGDIAWFGGYFTGNGIYRANFANNTCSFFNTGGQVTAITMDLAGNIWAAGYSSNVVYKFSPAGVLLGTYPAGGTLPHGLSVDFQGNIWCINHGPTPNVTKINANTGAIIGTYPLGGPGVADADPYLYSDFTGVQIDRQAPYARVGSWEAVYNSGVPDIPWDKVVWNTEPQGAVPAETSLSLSVRAANSLASLGVAPYLQVTNNASFGGVAGQFVQLRANLDGPGFVTPALSDVKVVSVCEPPSQSCCITDADCNDGNPCSADVCPAPGGVCQHAPIFDCCVQDNDCNDVDQCTVDTCMVASNTCMHAQLPNCCNSSSNCDDGIFCTVDVCSGIGGTCSSSPISGCCETDADCDDGNACSVDICPPNNLCAHSPTPGCCTKDADCKEIPDDLCTLNGCDLVSGSCTLQDLKPLGCCNVDQDCNDGDPCTSDACTGPGGTCQHVENPGCCTPNDPDVGQPCDIPKSPFDQLPCVPGQLVCVNGQFDCVGAVKPGIEVCDGFDNDCNGLSDAPVACPSPDDICLWGQCVGPCVSGEFPCPVGFQCYDGHCVPQSCANTVCPDGLACVDGLCVPSGAGGGGGGSATGGAGGNGGSASGSGGNVGGSGGQGVGGASGTGGKGGAPSIGAGGRSGDDVFGQPTGGGGCTCNAAGAHREPGAAALAALCALALAHARRRRRGSSPEGSAQSESAPGSAASKGEVQE